MEPISLFAQWRAHEGGGSRARTPRGARGRCPDPFLRPQARRRHRPWPCPSLIQVIHPPRHRYLAHADAQDKRCSEMPASRCGCLPLDYRPCHMPRMTIQHAFSSATPVTGDRCSRDDFKMASQAAPWRQPRKVAFAAIAWATALAARRSTWAPRCAVALPMGWPPARPRRAPL